jgi:hypothetical protein
MSANRGNLGPIGRDLAKSLRAADRDDRDAGAVALARRLAYLLDEARDELVEAGRFVELGPKYLATLTALGLTPAGRGAKGGAPGGTVSGSGTLDELRARRQRGQG